MIKLAIAIAVATTVGATAAVVGQAETIAVSDLAVGINVAAIALVLQLVLRVITFWSTMQFRKGSNEDHKVILKALANTVGSTQPAQVLKELREHVAWESSKYRDDSIADVKAAAERAAISERLSVIASRVATAEQASREYLRNNEPRRRQDTPTKTKGKL